MKQTVENRIAALEHVASSENADVSADRLIGAMRDTSPSVRSKAVQIVAEFEVEAAVPAVGELLHDRSEQVRLDAVKCLELFPDASVHFREKIRSLLMDKSFLVRIQTLESLELLHDQEALPTIAKLLTDENPLVRAYAARSIAGLGGRSYIQAIHDALRVEEEDSARAGFLEALFIMGEKEALRPFLQLLSSSDYRVRCAVANALQGMSLHRSEIEHAARELTHAEKNALGVADRSSVARALVKLVEGQ